MTKDDPGPDFWRPIRSHTGDVFATHPATSGFSSDVTAIVECEAGPFFVKAMRNIPGGRRDQIDRERQINPYVRSVSPALRWYADDGDWYVLGFDMVDGRCSDFDPGSPDLTAIVQTINRVAAIPTPDIATHWPETRWSRFAGNEKEARLFEGQALLHTDVNPDNFLIGARETLIVDWSWPTTGAPFIDLGCFVIQLIAAGHSAENAETWAASCLSWSDADPQGLDAFAAATVRMYRSFALRDPDAKWLRDLVGAAECWATHRHVTV